MNNNERIVFLDYVRVAACFMVMVVHSAENYYCVGSDTLVANTENLLCVSLYDGFCRMAVPLFMIVSAYLLIPMKEDQTWASFFQRRLTRIVPPMLTFMVLYATLPLLWNECSIEIALKRLYYIPFNFPDNAGHIWFLFPLLGLYLFIPIISPWLRQATAKQEQLFIGLWLISTTLHFLNRFIGNVWGQCFWNEFHIFYYFAGYLGYLVLAHYIREHLTWSDRKRIIVGVLCLAIGGIVTILSFYIQVVPGIYYPSVETELGWSFCTLNVAVLSTGVFLLFQTIKKTGPLYPWLLDISKLSFGMYLIHIFWLGYWSGMLMPLLPTAAAIPALACCTFLTSYLSIKLISYIPGSRWVIG